MAGKPERVLWGKKAKHDVCMEIIAAKELRKKALEAGDHDAVRHHDEEIEALRKKLARVANPDPEAVMAQHGLDPDDNKPWSSRRNASM